MTKKRWAIIVVIMLVPYAMALAYLAPKESSLTTLSASQVIADLTGDDTKKEIGIRINATYPERLFVGKNDAISVTIIFSLGENVSKINPSTIVINLFRKADDGWELVSQDFTSLGFGEVEITPDNNTLNKGMSFTPKGSGDLYLDIGSDLSITYSDGFSFTTFYTGTHEESDFEGTKLIEPNPDLKPLYAQQSWNDLIVKIILIVVGVVILIIALVLLRKPKPKKKREK